MEGLLLLSHLFASAKDTLSFTAGQSCVINAVFMVHFSIGSDPGILRVLLDSGATEQELLFETQITGSNWKNVSVTIAETKHIQV